MEHEAKDISFELEEWIFELLLSEEEIKKRKRIEKLKQIERLIFILLELISGLPCRQSVIKKEKLAELIEKREFVRG